MTRLKPDHTVLFERQQIILDAVRVATRIVLAAQVELLADATDESGRQNAALLASAIDQLVDAAAILEENMDI